MVECCKRWSARLYYVLLAVVYLVILIIELVTLGTFGVEFTRTNSLYTTDPVCVLYGSATETNEVNVLLNNNASCGFTFWGIVTVVLVLLVWTGLHIVMALCGKPKLLSLFRISDLIVTVCMGFLSLIISAVLTDGLKRTCDNTEPAGMRCPDKQLLDSNARKFYGNLNAAKDTSWTVTILFFLLAMWYGVLLFTTCCMRRRKKKEGYEGTKSKEESDKDEMSPPADVEDEKDKTPDFD